MRRLLSAFLPLALTLTLLANQAQAMFLQPDWFEVMQPGVGTNRYAYAWGDPVNFSDPGGNFLGTVVRGIVELVKGLARGGAAAGGVQRRAQARAVEGPALQAQRLPVSALSIV